MRERPIFVSTEDAWDQQRLFTLIIDRVEAISKHGDTSQFVKVKDLDKNKLFYRPERGTPERQKFESLEDLVFKILSASPVASEQLVADLAAKTKYPPDFIIGCLRLLVAVGNLVAVRIRSGVRLELSSIGKRKEQERSFAASFAHELTTQAERIGQLVAHGPTKGGYREELLRELLQRHIPQRFHAATGFIDGRDEQLDIIVYDQIDYAPVFRAGNLVVVPPESVRAIIEVKSQLTPGKLRDALKHIDGLNYAPGLHMPPAFLGIFAFDRKGTSAALTSTIAHFYRDDPDPEKLEHKTILMRAFDPIDAVCVLRKDMLTVEYFRVNASNGREILSPVVVELEHTSDREFQAALFLDAFRNTLDFRSMVPS
ncbi:DUF6602 domain-containing protein [Rhizobium ruizarguesonis]|nr:DUF6602 domain-containing protein [Rhizobium ruizarguesonis]